MTFKRNKYSIYAELAGFEAYVMPSRPLFHVELRSPRRCYLFAFLEFIWCAGHRNPVRAFSLSRPSNRDHLRLWETLPPVVFRY